MKRRNILAAGLVAGALALGGCEREAPTRDATYHNPVTVAVNAQRRFLHDLDGDNEVDLITNESRHQIFVAEGYDENNGYGAPDGKTRFRMTNEMRDAASQVFVGKNELAYMIAKADYQVRPSK